MVLLEEKLGDDFVDGERAKVQIVRMVDDIEPRPGDDRSLSLERANPGRCAGALVFTVSRGSSRRPKL
jgi:hypothetical protein